MQAARRWARPLETGTSSHETQKQRPKFMYCCTTRGAGPSVPPATAWGMGTWSRQLKGRGWGGARASVGTAPRTLQGQREQAEKHPCWLWNSRRRGVCQLGAGRGSRGREAGVQGTPSALPWLRRGQAREEGDAGFEPRICQQSTQQLGCVSVSALRAQDRSFRGKALAHADTQENLGRR